jgi:sulfite exporter TauE/SafE/copper chaperone CopZ
MSDTAPQKCTLYVHGMHCQACVILTESELAEHAKVVSATSDLASRTVDIYGNFPGMSPDEIARELSPLLTKHGYTLATQPELTKNNWKDFSKAVPIALGFIILFIILQKLGVVQLVDTSRVTYGTAFVIGIVASLSTCMAIVGGLVLSMSATFAKKGDSVRPQMLFHLGRLISFFILGGALGSIGSLFQLGITGTLILSLFVGVVMLLLGFNLLDITPAAKKLQLSMPKFIGTRALNLVKINHTLTPLLVGTATFFLPCGFTQSMQVFALSTGTFLTGALTMFAFALGTLPVLALVSFSSLSIKESRHAGVFFKSAGLIVIAFAILNILTSLAGAGILPSLITF